MNVPSKTGGNPLKSIQFRTALVALAIIFAIAAFAAKIIVDHENDRLLVQADREATLLAGFLGDAVSDAMLRGEALRVGEILKNAGRRGELSGIWLSDESGSVIASSRPGDAGKKIRNGKSGLDEKGLIFSRTALLERKKECGPCHAGDGPVIGYLTVGLPYARHTRELEVLKKFIAAGTLALGLVLAFSLVVLLRKSVARPVRTLAAAMEDAGRDMDVRLDGAASGEFKGLFEGFNSLMRRVRESRERSERAHLGELKKYSKELEEINRSLDEKINKLSALSGIGRSMNATRKLDDLLKMIINSAVKELRADRGSVMLLEKEVGELFVCTGKGLAPESHRKARFRLGEGVAGWVAANREPALVEDVSADPRYARGKGFGHRNSLLSVPLASTGGEVLGVINLERGTGRRPFAQGEMEYLLAMAGQASVAIENVELIQNLQKSYFDTISALAQAVEAKDPYTVGHCERVTQYSIAIGEEMRLSPEEISIIRYGATLHDLGKIGISEAVLNKPGRLTEEEYALMKEHAAIGENIVRGVDFLRKVRPIIRHHQERHDGAGYPDGLRGGEIPVPVAIVTLADNFDALTTDRPYRPAKTTAEAVEMIKEDSGRKYNPAVVEAFLRIFGEEDEACGRLRA